MSLLGIDVGSKTIKIVKANAGSRPKISESYMINTPQGAVRDGEIKDMLMVSSAIKTFMSEHHIKAKEVSFTIQSPNVITRELSLPAFGKSEIMPAIEFELSQIFPGIVQTHTIAYQQTSKQGMPIEGLTAFGPTALLLGYVELAENLGLELKNIDISTNSVSRTIKNYCNSADFKGNILLVDIGIEGSQVTVLSNGRVSISRYITTGVSALDQIVATRCDLSLKEAEEARVNDNYKSLDISDEDLDIISRLGYSSIEDQIKQTIDFFTSNKSNEPIKSIYIFGGGCNFPNLEKHFEILYKLPVKILTFDKLKLEQPDYLMMAAVGALLVDRSYTQDIRLIPGLQILQKSKAQTNRVTILVVAGLLIAIVGAGLYGYSYLGIQMQKDRTDNLIQEAAKYSEVTSVKASLITTQASLNQLQSVVKLSDEKELINTELLTSIAKNTPDKLLINSYTTQDGIELSMTGIAVDRLSIATFLYKLKELPQIDAASLVNVGARIGPDGLPVDYNFTLVVQMKGR